ncbi:hypothetical protein N7491_005241 [Penicillium cf. griseofulvum]|uniref:MACPF domain-containing protein n=1 Tax=Penicillium cf. griseofulvum TaxID=2972120 RepID=A0A9W9M4X9_9EURO|nr:hypothetical protein N7472_007933 [Penicillium cf. griseofulvum]KAJ5434646.1 hypothetical protein N7491_005241 [Penicillium cf. griseofulvum]
MASEDNTFNDANLLGQSLTMLPGEHDPFNVDIIEGDKSTIVGLADEMRKAQFLPEWNLKQEVHNKYVRFFRSWGTHYIKSCTFGARFQLKIENHASEAQSKENFEVNVGAEYNGIANVKTKVYGGSSSSSLILGNAPDEPEEYQEAFDGWANSLNDAVVSNLINVKIDSIGNLLSNSSVQEHNDNADKLVKALDFLASKRLVEGFLKLSLPKESPSRTHVRELSIQGAPGVLIRQSSQEKSRLEIDCTVRMNETFSLSGVSRDPVQVALQPPAASKSEIQLLYSGLDNTK